MALPPSPSSPHSSGRNSPEEKRDIQHAIVAENLSRDFRRRVRGRGLRSGIQAFFRPSYLVKNAVNEVSFKIPTGSCVGLVGANGAGKTTLLKMASGLLHPSRGELQVLGYRPSERNHEFLRSIGLVMGQKSQLWSDIPASDTYELLAAIYRIPRAVFEKRLEELSALFKVEKLLGVQVRRLSLGERMKLEIIAALLHEPKLLFLDEPTIGLDLLAKETIRNFIREYNSRHGTTIILSSHDMGDIIEVCDRLIIIAQGQIRFEGSLADFRQQSASFTKQVLELIRE